MKGGKDLFNGLAIDRLESGWTKYPIIHIDLDIGEYDTVDSLRQRLGVILSRHEEQYGANPKEESIGDRFVGIIKRAYETTGRQVVILIDEYDKPLLNAIGNSRLQEQLCDVLRSFYVTLKSSDKYIRFAMLTGVTKFGHLNVFSNLQKITW